jgi:Domain of unknown function (DUF6946)
VNQRRVERCERVYAWAITYLPPLGRREVAVKPVAPKGSERSERGLTEPSGARQSPGVMARMIRVCRAHGGWRFQAQLSALPEAVVATLLSDDEVIEQGDIEDVGGCTQSLRQSSVIGAWPWIAAGMVVHDDHARRAQRDECRYEHIGGRHERARARAACEQVPCEESMSCRQARDAEHLYRLPVHQRCEGGCRFPWIAELNVRHAHLHVRDHQWVNRRSAKEVARAWSGLAAPADILRAVRELPGLESFEAVTVIPEHATDLDGFGEGRNHDLIVMGTASGKRVLIGIEAKCDEELGPRIGAYLEQADRANVIRSADGRRLSNVPARIRLLKQLVFRDDAVDLSEQRYQLLHGVGGTLIEAAARRADVAVFIVHTFRRRLRMRRASSGTRRT